MQVREAMTTDPVTVVAGTSVCAALRLLADHRLTVLPVVDEAGRIVGVVSEVDLLRGRLRPDHRLAPHAPSGSGAADEQRARMVVADLMTRRTVLVHPGTDLREVGRIVGMTGIKSLPVVDAADQVVGMVSRSDVVRMLARTDDLLQQDIVDALSDTGLRGWRVDVRNGVVDLSPPGDGAVDDGRARDIAEAVPGVTTVRVRGRAEV